MKKAVYEKYSSHKLIIVSLRTKIVHFLISISMIHKNIVLSQNKIENTIMMKEHTTEKPQSLIKTGSSEQIK